VAARELQGRAGRLGHLSCSHKTFSRKTRSHKTCSHKTRMTVEPIGIIALLLGLISLALPAPFIFYAFVCSTLLGASAALTLDSLGGTSIQPAHLLLGFLTYKSVADPENRKRIWQSISAGQPGFWLLLTTLYCVASAYLMPRLLASGTAVFPVRSLGYRVPLEPAMANLTQSVYFVGDFVCFVLVSAYASSLFGRQVLQNAILLTVILNLMFAVLDLVTYFTGTTELLDFIRNANYSMLNDTEVAGFKRIVGSFTEASSFGATTLGYFALTMRLWLLGVRPRLTFGLTVGSLAALLFSTSTTAYVGLVVFLVFAYASTLFRVVFRNSNLASLVFVVGAPLALAVIALVISLNDDYAAYFRDMADTFVLNKMATDSGIERSSWNRQAMQNFYDTFGFGAGVGSVRASSFPIAVLANFGIIGALLFLAFFVTVFYRGVSTGDGSDAYVSAARWTCVGWLITAATSGALVDLGLPFFVLAALASSRSAKNCNPNRLRALADVG
jgi:hypothetical protein